MAISWLSPRMISFWQYRYRNSRAVYYLLYYAIVGTLCHSIWSRFYRTLLKHININFGSTSDPLCTGHGNLLNYRDVYIILVLYYIWIGFQRVHCWECCVCVELFISEVYNRTVYVLSHIQINWNM